MTWHAIVARKTRLSLVSLWACREGGGALNEIQRSSTCVSDCKIERKEKVGLWRWKDGAGEEDKMGAGKEEQFT